MPQSPWLRPEAAGPYVGVAVATLKRWRATGTGPRYQKVGGRLVSYHVDDLNVWLSRDVRETADSALPVPRRRRVAA